MSEPICIPWSGGLDSTYLVLKAIREGRTVYAPYFKLTNNEHKSAAELQARRNLLDEIDILADASKYGQLIAPIGPVANAEFNENHTVLIQAMLWPVLVTAYCPTEVKEVWLAYVLEDHAVSWETEIKDLYAALSKFRGLDGENALRVHFPIKKVDKDTIVDRLKSLTLQHELLGELIWTCENPRVQETEDERKFTPCHHCKSCKNVPYSLQKCEKATEPVPPLPSPGVELVIADLSTPSLSISATNGQIQPTSSNYEIDKPQEPQGQEIPKKKTNLSKRRCSSRSR